MAIHTNSDSIWAGKKKLSFWQRLFRKTAVVDKALTTPEIISQSCQGLLLGNKNVKSLLFSTDMALIENNDADGILAVYPFPPSPKIIKTLIDFSGKPVICGVGGGMTRGKKSLEMALYAQEMGAAGIIVNIPFENKDIKSIREKISIPIIASVASSDYQFLKDKIDSGVAVFHVSGGMDTNTIVKDITSKFPGFPIMATGGKSLSNIQESISSGAKAVVLSPPSNKDLFKTVMDKHRSNLNQL